MMQEKSLKEYTIRPLGKGDDLVDLTYLLHAAYKSLAERGLRFLACDQDVAMTEERIRGAECFVAIYKNRIIGTMTYCSMLNARGTPWYDKSFVASFGQLAVHPDFQHLGIGSKLIDLAESLATRDGAEEIALDTAEDAADLVSYYNKLGYRFIEHTKWEVSNFKSVVLSKKLNEWPQSD